MSKKKLGIAGCGHLGSIIARAAKDGLLPDYELCGLLGKTPEKAELLSRECGGRACSSLAELLSLKPDYIAEAASVEAVKQLAVPALSSGTNLVLLSIGALADPDFYTEVFQTARDHGTRVYLASGAVGGFDVLRTVSLMNLSRQKKTEACIHTHKGPLSLKGTALFEDRLLQSGTKSDVFTGNAKEAIRILPTKVNVAVAAALATAGPEDTGVKITSVEAFQGDDHCITASADDVKASVDIYSRTSDIAGWSVVALLRNLASPIVM